MTTARGGCELDAAPLLPAAAAADSGVRTMTTDMRAGLPSRRTPKRTMASWLLLSASGVLLLAQRL
jgi:hypothetical protein